MINKSLYSIFKQGSTTFFYSSLFFPNYLKKDVFVLYGFVRKADNFVDSMAQKINGFYNFKEKYERSIIGEKSNNFVIDEFVKLSRKKGFKQKWTESFLKSMEMDITKHRYNSIEDTLKYIYGSAEVVGLYMSRIMNLPKKAEYYAKYLGRSMQYINFLRDINEDNQLGRIYFPNDDLEEYNLKNLEYEYVKNHEDNFFLFIEKQLSRYCEWQSVAEEGFKYMPKRYLIPVKTASEMYNWTAEQIYKDPMIIYKVKVKPMINQIFSKTLLNVIDPRKPMKRKIECRRKRLPQLNYE